MRFDLIIRGGWVVLETVEAVDIGVADGSIVEVAPELDGPAREVIDASGLCVFPGVVDAHVHFNEPGRADWEGIATGSAALAAGGGTCFVDMPLNASPPTLDGASFDLKRAAAEAQSLTDFGLWGGIVPGNLDDLEELADRGVVGFKAFMADSGIDDFLLSDEDTLLEGMRRAAMLGLPVAVHAESEEVVAELARLSRDAGRTAACDFAPCRPIRAEVEAIRRAVALAEEAGCSLHIVHVSSAAGVIVVADARARGVDVTCETCPHYLVFTEEDIERIGVAAKCAPPLRARPEVERLWEQVRTGAVDFIASDHSPSPPAMKNVECFFDAWGGISGCQSTLPVMLDEGHRRRGLSLPDIARLLGAAPSRRLRFERKGRISEGFDADLVLVDMDAAETLREEHLLYRHRISPYLGRKLHGMVKRTLVRGRTVFLGGRPVSERTGKLVRPAPR